jgi:hypothetical protein
VGRLSTWILHQIRRNFRVYRSKSPAGGRRNSPDRRCLKCQRGAGIWKMKKFWILRESIEVQRKWICIIAKIKDCLSIKLSRLNY